LLLYFIIPQHSSDVNHHNKKIKEDSYMTKANSEIRTAMQNNKIPAWAIGAEIGVHENTVLRRLRFELSEQEKQKYLSIIDKLSAEKT
jgi:hypothetical protein